LTFADFALGEGRFAKQFRKAPPETWNDEGDNAMVLLADFLKLPADDRDGKFPYIWAVDKQQHLMRVLVSAELVNSCAERQQFWQQLKDVAGLNKPEVDEAAIAAQARAELLGQIGASLASLGAGVAVDASAAPAATPVAKSADGYEPVYVDTPECTACDECTKLAPKAFAYNDDKKSVVINPQGAKFADLVKAAEKCTASCIHPGTPWNLNEPGIDKLIARAAKYN